MSEPTEREFKGKITLTFDAKDIQRYIDALAQVTADSPKAQRAIEALEKRFAGAGRAAERAASGIKKYIAQYEAFPRVRSADDKAGPVNQQFPLLQQKLKLALELEREQTKAAQEFARQRLAVEEETRRKELAALRAHIQERARMQDIIDRDHARALKENERRDAAAAKKAQDAAYQTYASNMPSALKKAQDEAFRTYAENIRYTQREERKLYEERIKSAQELARERLAVEEDARRKELAALRAHIQERARMEDIRNRDHIRALKENARREAEERKKAQDAAYATYASNMPSAVKKAQDAAYASYAANIRYTQQQERFYAELPRARYALYDVAQTWGMVSAATLGAAAAVGSVGIAYQREFAQVQRTTGVAGEAAQQLRRDLEDLSTQIPESFSSISQIASLGGQLGIAADGIDEFTSVTARLTATTNLSAEAAGTALGRFQALLGVPSSQFENLASSILKVGVNSVATETQIVQIATQISSMGAFAGLTADQVVGLAGALASTGTQPELARGTITRVFTLMSEAVAGTTDKLGEFARIADVSAEDFRKAWGTSEFAGVFQKFLQGIAREGDAAVQTLHGLGITSVRDVPALMKLADAGEVVSRSFANAKSGFQEGTELAEQYGVVSETIAAKLTKLGNTLKAIMATIADDSSLNFFGVLLDMVQKVAEAFLAIARNPVGKFILGVVAAMTALVGVIAAARAGHAMYIASMYAMITAQKSLAATANAAGISMRQLGIQMLFGGNAARVAAGGTVAFATALRGLLISTGIGAALVAVGFAVNELSKAMASSSERAREIFGPLDAAVEAIRKDTKAVKEGAEAYREHEITLKNAVSAREEHTGATTAEILEQFGLKKAVEDTTEAVEAQTVALGENMRQYLINTLASNEDFKRIWTENKELIAETGFELQTFIQKALEGERGGEKYLDTFITKVLGLKKSAQDLYDEMQWDSGVSEEDLNRQQALIYKYEDQERALNALARQVYATDTQISDALDTMEYHAELAGGVAAATADAGDEFSQMGDKALDAANAILEAANASLATENALFSLGEAIYENGLDFSSVTEAGRANLSALMQTINALVAETVANGGNAADAIAGLMEALSAMGVNVAQDLGFLADMVAKLGGTSGMDGIVDATQRAIRGIGQGFGSVAPKAMNRTRDAAREVKKEIKTVADYASELSTVLTDAFNYRFGQQKAKDATNSLWAAWKQDIKDAKERAKELRLEIRSIRAEAATLQSRRSVLTYQLDVARMFGDEQRVEQILAEIGEVDSDLAENKQNLTNALKELKDVQDTLNPTLKGNSEAAREQRDRVLALIESYQKQIEEAARNGASQKELRELAKKLKAEFEKQAEQIGLSKDELGKYTKAFDDMDTIIKKVPRKVTTDFKANMSPAEKALSDWRAKLEKERKKIEKPFKVSAKFDSKVDSNLTGLKAAQQALAEALKAQAKAYKEQPGGGTRVEYWDKKVNYWRKVLSAYKGYAEGGFTGRGGKYDVAGVVHRGEFVFPKEYVNQSTGLPYANVLGTMAHAMGAGSRGSASPNHIQLVELLPTQLEELARAVSTRVAIDGRVVAAVSNNYNSAQRARGAG